MSEVSRDGINPHTPEPTNRRSRQEKRLWWRGEVAAFEHHQLQLDEPGVRAVGGERGSATLWGVALMGLLMAVATAFAIVGTVRVARYRVNSAADLSALAAARLALLDPQEACARAGALAVENGVELTRCEIKDEVADVWTSLSISLPIGGARTVKGRARAGPVT
ncbi:flp pilus-assembly TadE/G-like family protein [Actinomadura sp. ATCC 31491]|uniref:Flp pilus-assembly TadE/G-like family protein n=1 Tax=Actinomadura luzonensis TaxID=2805427 RepID=A0ABT0FRA2_9ACTN|nr:Rv3654c family TadE-like protein [Actinomadura luzonensis]MCK2214575.1 flp pilus-assembly TadE/G-like family protein [Actinomadura luzonensis]